MITGVVNSVLQAVVRLTVRGPGGQSDVDAILDTGFNDSLVLPPSVSAALALPLGGYMPAVLADSRPVSLRFVEAVVLWNGQPRDVTALEADGPPLIGMGLLDGHRLTLEVFDGGRVMIEPWP